MHRECVTTRRESNSAIVRVACVSLSCAIPRCCMYVLLKRERALFLCHPSPLFVVGEGKAPQHDVSFSLAIFPYFFPLILLLFSRLVCHSFGHWRHNKKRKLVVARKIIRAHVDCKPPLRISIRPRLRTSSTRDYFFLRRERRHSSLRV